MTNPDVPPPDPDGWTRMNHSRVSDVTAPLCPLCLIDIYQMLCGHPDRPFHWRCKQCGFQEALEIDEE